MKNKSSFLIKILPVSLLMLFYNALNAQNVGIGTATPDYRLHITNANSSLLKIENTTALNVDVKTDLFFKTGGFYTGGIKAIGTGLNTARLGFFSYAAGSAASLYERMS